MLLLLLGWVECQVKQWASPRACGFCQVMWGEVGCGLQCSDTCLISLGLGLKDNGHRFFYPKPRMTNGLLLEKWSYL